MKKTRFPDDLGLFHNLKMLGVKPTWDINCDTWYYHRHRGWRGFLIRCGVPRSWFKPEKKERVFYQVRDVLICSPENYEYLMSRGIWSDSKDQL